MKLKSKLKTENQKPKTKKTEIQNAFCYSNFVGGIRRKLVSKSVGSAHKLG